MSSVEREAEAYRTLMLFMSAIAEGDNATHLELRESYAAILAVLAAVDSNLVEGNDLSVEAISQKAKEIANSARMEDEARRMLRRSGFDA